ncbi:AAA family ATPase [Microvirga guangxiensis]|uniref:ATPase family associated with various cellular activities (AAA) n=1 Tax=Microvirga guangxiensis TaxID=549386 RepID=A0A1G5HNW6_9HYPH|nr:AAA family ATPase [Microvirga guangxiensis]SCY65476.1 ATPase family associated with various cellular activities (AAA) [Microvirga guangxiensis]
MAVDDTLREVRRARRVRRHFERRKEAAIAGLHLPTEYELLAGMPFLGNDIQEDMRTFAERLLPRLRRKVENLHFEAVVYCLEQLTVSAGSDEVKALADILEVARTSLPDGVRSWRLRCRIYLAHLGDHGAATDLAREALTAAIGLEHYPDDWAAGVTMITAALGWLAYSASNPDFAHLGTGARVSCGRNPARAVDRTGSSLIELVENQSLLVRASEALATSEVPVGNGAGGKPQGHGPEPSCTAASVSVIVFDHVGNANTGEGKKVAKELEGLAGKALPLVPVPDLKVARAALRTEFPYAADVIDDILRDVALRSHVQIRPTILVGSPGCGKSRFATRLLKVLNLPHDMIPCGGVSDGAFAGTPRRWSTGEPSLPVALITRYKAAGPGAILDEVEKVGTSRHNGQAHDALLAFLERETASRFHDPYVQAPCDLSHVTWLMTANSLEGLSAPLRDRCRVIPFPVPGCEHLPILSRQIISDILAEQGLDCRWATPLDEVETAAVVSAWPGGSLRKLRRLVEAVLMSRDVRH